MHLQAAASRIQEAQAAEAVARSDAEASQATAEARDEEAASLRRQLAELEGTLAAQQDADVSLMQSAALPIIASSCYLGLHSKPDFLKYCSSLRSCGSISPVLLRCILLEE